MPPGLHQLPLAMCFVQNISGVTLPAHELFQFGSQLDYPEAGLPVLQAKPFDTPFTSLIGSCGPVDIPAGGFGPAFFGNLLPCKHNIGDQGHHALGGFGFRVGGGYLSRALPVMNGLSVIRVSVFDVLLRFTAIESIPGAATIRFPTALDAGTWVGTVLDPDLIFADLGPGDPGWCIYKNGDYYAVQAPCGEEDDSSSSGDGFISSG